MTPPNTNTDTPPGNTTIRLPDGTIQTVAKSVLLNSGTSTFMWPDGRLVSFPDGEEVWTIGEMLGRGVWQVWQCRALVGDAAWVGSTVWALWPREMAVEVRSALRGRGPVDSSPVSRAETPDSVVVGTRHDITAHPIPGSRGADSVHEAPRSSMIGPLHGPVRITKLDEEGNPTGPSTVLPFRSASMPVPPVTAAAVDAARRVLVDVDDLARVVDAAGHSQARDVLTLEAWERLSALVPKIVLVWGDRVVVDLTEDGPGVPAVYLVDHETDPGLVWVVMEGEGDPTQAVRSRLRKA